MHHCASCGFRTFCLEGYRLSGFGGWVKSQEDAGPGYKIQDLAVFPLARSTFKRVPKAGTALPSFAGTDLMVTCAQVQQTAQQEQSNVVLLWIAKKYQKGRGRSSQLLLSLPDHDRVSLQLTNSKRKEPWLSTPPVKWKTWAGAATKSRSYLAI